MRINQGKTYTKYQLDEAGFKETGTVYGMTKVYVRGNERILCDPTTSGDLEVSVKYLYQKDGRGKIIER